MKLSSILEFSLTTAVLAGWAIACTAAFQATRVEPARPAAEPTAAVSQTVGSEEAAKAANATLEAALEQSLGRRI